MQKQIATKMNADDLSAMLENEIDSLKADRANVKASQAIARHAHEIIKMQCGKLQAIQMGIKNVDPSFFQSR